MTIEPLPVDVDISNNNVGNNSIIFFCFALCFIPSMVAGYIAYEHENELKH